MPDAHRHEGVLGPSEPEVVGAESEVGACKEHDIVEANADMSVRELI